MWSQSGRPPEKRLSQDESEDASDELNDDSCGAQVHRERDSTNMRLTAVSKSGLDTASRLYAASRTSIYLIRVYLPTLGQPGIVQVARGSTAIRRPPSRLVGLLLQ
jgi:hypothetical protein